MPHLVAGVGRPVIVSARELIDVSVKMLAAHVVVGSDVTALQARPERLYAVRMGLPMHVLFDAVLDRLMVRDIAVARVLVRVDLCAVLDAGLDEGLERRFVGVLYGSR